MNEIILIFVLIGKISFVINPSESIKIKSTELFLSFSQISSRFSLKNYIFIKKIKIYVKNISKIRGLN